ncbi:bifunctional 2-C-methyl-D-erythritol 4-phosphate cytidylyltransferase/2-C-methyl-D-erythritol 2,4-cyclodiphosphate synthase [Aestuariispira insulae]|uniref:Bifunctional enzyme IspD/IspF n=1 Tax=Aestuariispira insulae TaxID=1461337 RepID=A0A3D9HUU3_9PROT|nr:bifunctional 2-C-methyl-D-erythritol 4-phosphate cytidylyltransferase/2-C-methyl-D-erythritol 2,4-cyclodiphosphate synthase [Aestuariispira insulae]RED53258.1 2-C-methyl-D-erythritol 2,4-cyclodiphosphate synthase [Aestuariispira insulae]
MPGCVALIVAAGRGKRAGSGIPKQYRDAGGMPLLRRTVCSLNAHPVIDSVHVVIHPDDQELYQQAVKGLELAAPIHGGTERQDSVRHGLEALEDINPDLVLIHDAARPFASADLISRTITALKDHVAAIPGLPVVDTVKRTDKNGHIAETLDRASLYRAQTPQGFRFVEILAAHRQYAGEILTDDAAVAEKAGLDVLIVPGEESNIKLTTPEDFIKTGPHMNQSRLPRCGNGFDVHRFTDGDHVILCGVKIPHNQKLEGHSDADVAMHALTDALLGTIAAGDIGTHFPPSDPQWKGAASDKFLSHAAKLIRERGGEIANVDITIICQAPKVGPYRETMTISIAQILEIPEDRVSIKATTTEKLGFTGRKEGIAAQATAMVLA